MPRNKVSEKRPFNQERVDRLSEAVEAVKGDPTMSVRKAAEEFGVSKSAIGRRLKKDVGSVGAPTVLSKMEEALIAKLVDDVAEWGFPIGRLEIKLMVKDLLDRKGVVSRFRNNIPGDDWFTNFMRRNKLSKRVAANIKVARASVDRECVDVFFDSLEKSGIDYIKPENLFNYDETNFKNETGKSWVIVRRGRRRVERVSDDTKQSFSLMWCGSAAGRMLPPMVVYGRVLNVYENWTGGPDGTKFDCTNSGWFDSKSFQKWFAEVLVPNVQDLEGPIVLLGDNLGSHFSADIVRWARERNIFFAMLPPNATHLLQPLDVAVFGPMKRVWREMLNEYHTGSK